MVNITMSIITLLTFISFIYKIRLYLFAHRGLEVGIIISSILLYYLCMILFLIFVIELIGIITNLIED